MKKILAKFCSLALGLCLSGLTLADEVGAQKLAEKLNDLKTFQAHFEQRVSKNGGHLIDRTSGVFSIERPNHFRWEVEKDYQQTIVADGDHIYTYDPELEQVTIQDQSKILADSPLLLMTSDAKSLADAFDIQILKLQQGEADQLFQLTPKNSENGMFEKVHILFKNNQIAELMMSDSLGQQTSVVFSDIKTNPSLAKALFHFDVPEGVDLIDSREKPIPAESTAQHDESAN